MTVRLVHGVREWRPGRQMAPLRRALWDLSVPAEHVSYGPIWLPVSNRHAVNAIIEAVRPGDDVVAFSNGAYAAHQALELGCPIRRLYLISPALNVQAKFPSVEHVAVYYSPDDRWPRLARLYRRGANLMPWRWRRPHGWGAMGREGYQGNESHVVNRRLPGAVRHDWSSHDAAVAMIAHDVAAAYQDRGA